VEARESPQDQLPLLRGHPGRLGSTPRLRRAWQTQFAHIPFPSSLQAIAHEEGVVPEWGHLRGLSLFLYLTMTR